MEALLVSLFFVKIVFAYDQISNVSYQTANFKDPELIPDFRIVLSSENPRQSISSPGFPHEYYPPNTQIIYEVQMKLEDPVQSLSSRILLTFEMFAVEDSVFCTKDGFEIADASDQVRVYCGSQVGRTLLSEGSKIYIRFFTDSNVESRGYSVLLEMYNTGCSKYFSGVSSGSFASPNHPGRYYSEDMCVWKITAPEGKRIRVDFDQTFDIRAYEPLCVQDYLAISLTGDLGTDVKRYCHGRRPLTLVSLKNSVLFVFRTDCCFEGKGFRATFSVIGEDEVTPTIPPPEPVPQTCSCGIENLTEDERIYGGKDVQPPNRYPWMVALVKQKNNKDQFYCGGALINKQYVLTAAHCLEKEKVAETRIAVGAHNQNSNATTVQVADFIMHPQFKNKVYFNDIALVKLRDPVEISKTVRPICLPNSDDLTVPNTTAVVAGWGLQNAKRSRVLQEVDVSIVSNPKCIAKFGGVVLDTNVCAGGEMGKDACGGDSGGPLFTKQGERWHAVGLVSWGIGCGRETFPGVYTRVSKYVKWIQQNTADAPSCDEEISPPVQPNLDNCGIPNVGEANRIVGGEEATPFEFPWMAMIVYDRRVVGAGALVSPYYVLTAASVFDNIMEWYPELLDIFLGRHTLTKEGNSNSKRYSVRMVYQHPQYGKPSPYNNDLAILKLDAPEGVPGLYKPICLPRTDAWYPPDLSLTAAGWGSTSSSSDGSSALRKVDLLVWADEDCEKRYPGWFTDKMICAYKQGADTCHGDSGAPLMRYYYGRYYIAGLSSWASNKGCAVRNSPRVFSSVHANLKWVSSVTGLEFQ